MTDDRPDWDEYFLGIAHAVSARSTCSRLHVGAVLTHRHQIVATGYNGAPAGDLHCVHTDDSPCTTALHAEANALDYLTVLADTLYVTHQPCLSCAERVVEAGVEKVVYTAPYRKQDGVVYLQRHGVQVQQLVLVTVS